MIVTQKHLRIFPFTLPERDPFAMRCWLHSRPETLNSRTKGASRHTTRVIRLWMMLVYGDVNWPDARGGGGGGCGGSML